jgi:putative DNA primase/helicase
MKQAALAFAGRGWAPFPLTPRSKRPLPGSNGLLDASTDPERIERMWRDHLFANVGINCGMSNLYVVDVDTAEWKGKQGGRTWAGLTGEHGHVDTLTIQTWSGGLQFYYQMPEGMALTNTTGKLGPDVDTRGVGGYVVAPPSFVREVEGGETHEGLYMVAKDLEVASLPLWIPEAVAKPERAKPLLAGPVAAEEAVLARMEQLATELRNAPDGQGNDIANRVAFLAGQYAGAEQIGEDQVTSILLDAVAGWQWRDNSDFHAITATIIRAVDQGTQKPRPWERPVASSATPVDPAAVVAALNPQQTIPDPFAVPEEDTDPVEEADRAISMWATDNGQGVFLRDRVGDMLYAVGVGWMVWDGTRWKRVAPEVIQNRISRFYRTQFEKMLKQYMATMDEKYSGLAKAFKSFMGTGRLLSIMNHLKITDGVLVDVKDLDTHKHLLNTPNGIVDLRDGSIAPHDRTMLFTKVTRGSYRPGFRHDDWNMALTALLPEQAGYMKIRMGQAITGYIPESDDALFLVGHGSNGKSLWTSDGVFRAIGDYGALAQATLISKVTEGSGPTPERFGLMGCRFVLIEELPEGRSLSIAEVKRITGMSVITARDLHEKQVTFDATHTLFITTNYLPTVAEVDEGSWRRFCCIRFPFRFRSAPEADTDRPGDAGLKSRLREGESGQHDAILTWLVEGAMAYFADRSLIMEDKRPPAVATATLDWRKEADRILAYVDERLTFPEPGAEQDKIVRKEVYEDFCRFLEERGHSKWSMELFFSRFRSHETVRSRGVSEGQTRSLTTISRAAQSNPYAKAPDLPKVARVFTGVVFRTEES